MKRWVTTTTFGKLSRGEQSTAATCGEPPHPDKAIEWEPFASGFVVSKDPDEPEGDYFERWTAWRRLEEAPREPEPDGGGP